MQLAIVAAGFSASEADQLRRAMGAWRRKGELERYRARLLAGLSERGYSVDFAERLCHQIEGFGSYGFPESHAASFALLVYFSAWFKYFEPAIFLCALLNSQPMGFYSPSQLIQDARRHGVTVLPADVCASDWDCILENQAQMQDTHAEERTRNTLAQSPAERTVAQQDNAHASRLAADGLRRPQPQAPVRLGLRMIKGLSREAVGRIVAARRAGRFESVQDLALRAELEPATLNLLARGGALQTLAGHRRQALWQAAGSRPDPGLLRTAPVSEAPARLRAPTEAADLVADYAHLGFTLGNHPLSHLREHLRAMRFSDARAIQLCADRQVARAAGIVTCRQRPGTAKGVLFITLEDETGLINIIVRPELIERQRRILLGAHLLGVYGQISRQGSVVHLQASRVVDHSHLLGQLVTSSRDFH